MADKLSFSDLEIVRMSSSLMAVDDQEKEGLKEEELCLAVYAEGRCLVEYRPDPVTIPELPEPAKAAKAPEEIMTCEELYLNGLHIEQYLSLIHI